LANDNNNNNNILTDPKREKKKFSAFSESSTDSVLLTPSLRDVEAVKAVMGHVLFTIAVCCMRLERFHHPILTKVLQSTRV